MDHSVLRLRRILTEFLSVAGFFALSVSVCESDASALERITVTVCGELADEFANSPAGMRAGPSLAAVRNACGRRTPLPLGRFIDGILAALEDDTPLADAVRTQAGRPRALQARAYGGGGAEEIPMTVPLVFGILTLTVLFTVFPGVSPLDIGI